MARPTTLATLLRGFEDMQAVRPAMRLVVIEGASHGGPAGPMTRPEFLAAVRELLAAHPSTQR